jgi:hypothetical protein
MTDTYTWHGDWSEEMKKEMILLTAEMEKNINDPKMQMTDKEMHDFMV